MNWLHYLIEANIYLGVFYLCYCLFLTNETHYTLSRIYLLFSCVIAFVLPVTQLSILKPAENLEFDRPAAYVNVPAMIHLAPPPPPEAPPLLSWQDSLFYAYIIGAVLALGIFGFRLYQLYKLSRRNKQLLDNSCQIIHLQDDNTAFSFFNYLFIGTNISQSDTIIAHELVHIRQKHSWDIMLLEVLKVINWFNPFIYLTQRSLKTVHEYIADEQTAAHERDALTYSSFLLNNAYGLQGSTIAHSFFNYNLLKKRIIMLNKNRSGKLARLKYLAVLPLCGGMLCASTLAFAKDYGWVDLTPVPKKAIAEKKNVADSSDNKYTLRLTNKKEKLTAISDHIVFDDKKTGERVMYSVTTFSSADQAEILARRGVLIEKVLKNTPITDTPQQKLPAPPQPPPYDPVYSDLIKYVAKHMRYPAKARQNKVDGNILLSLRLDATHKLTDIKVEQGIGSGCDEEAIRALKSYAGTISKAPGNYKLMATYMLIGDTDKPIHNIKPVSQDLAGQRNFIGQVIVNGFGADQIKLPPPPPAPPKPVKTAGIDPATLQENHSLKELYQHLARTVRYPTKARNANLGGRVILTFNVSDKKIGDIRVVRGVSPEIDNEVVRSLKEFDKPLAIRSDYHYSIPITFVLERSGSAKPAVQPEYPVTAHDYPKGTSLVLNEVVIVGYLDEPSKVSPSTSGKVSNPQGRQSFIIPPAPAGTNKNTRLHAPPAAYDKAYVNLYKHMTQSITYPVAAIKNNTTGNVILSYQVDANHKITDIKVMNSVANGCDESAVAALKSYRGNVDKTSGNYVIAATFVLKGFTKKFEPIGDLRFKSNFAGIVVVSANAI